MKKLNQVERINKRLRELTANRPKETFEFIENGTVQNSMTPIKDVQVKVGRVCFNAPESHDYRCPTCGSEHGDNEFGYNVKGKHYPEYANDIKYYNGSYDMHDWDELHYCEKCKKEFWFTNGAC